MKGERPVPVAVLGAGRVFERFHLPALSATPALRLVGVGDPDPARLAWARARLPDVPAMPSFPDLLATGAEALLVLTPPATHARHATAALEAGLHVLVEKPMALTLEDARAMAEAATGARRHLQVGFTRRFREPYRRVRARLRGAAAGASGNARARFELAFPPLAWGAHADFLGDDRAGGGVLDDVVSHQADLLRSLLDAPVERVRVRPAPADETAPGWMLWEAELRGGMVAECLAAHGPYVEWLELDLAGGRTLTASGSGMREFARGRPGYARRLADFSDRVALVVNRLVLRPNVTARSFARQLEDFARAVGGGTSEGATPADGVATVAVIEACRRSAASGEWERVG